MPEISEDRASLGRCANSSSPPDHPAPPRPDCLPAYGNGLNLPASTLALPKFSPHSILSNTNVSLSLL